jgi:hypothetical protein
VREKNQSVMHTFVSTWGLHRGEAFRIIGRDGSAFCQCVLPCTRPVHPDADCGAPA